MRFDLLRTGAILAGAALVIAASTAARADAIYDATGGNPALAGFDPINTVTGVGPIAADRFVAPFTGTVTSVTLDLALSGGLAAPGAFSVDIFTDGGAGGPGAVLGLLAFVNDASLTPSFALYTYTSATPIDITAGQTYYAGVLDLLSAAELANTLDPAVISRPTVLAGGFYYNNGGVQANAGAPYQVLVNATPVGAPEPSGVAVALAGLAVLGMARVRRRLG